MQSNNFCFVFFVCTWKIISFSLERALENISCIFSFLLCLIINASYLIILSQSCSYSPVTGRKLWNIWETLSQFSDDVLPDDRLIASRKERDFVEANGCRQHPATETAHLATSYQSIPVCEVRRHQPARPACHNVSRAHTRGFQVHVHALGY